MLPNGSLRGYHPRCLQYHSDGCSAPATGRGTEQLLHAWVHVQQGM